MEDKQKVGLIVTIVTVLLCGCPGLCAIVYGTMMATSSSWATEVTGNPEAFGIPSICIGAIMLLIPIAAGIYTIMQRRKKNDLEVVEEDIEIPPAI